ncbi:glycerol acyltransferase [Janibacter sp. Soil728]|uniref:lysophospholipid acyltransferase family protein n=1 Tax=Janibacter sp. Soil728 TaxID=1736393 RepID=UPI0006F8C7D1|nr:lysophospholipid acyltransferase family protein [Janibacter sp. Soil728]KRE38530.1 glycerol acyltransferase [Janibacter sp. Soil728]
MVVHRTPTPVMYRVAAGILRAGMRAVARYEVTGIEHVPTQGGFVLTPNHLSYIDPFPWAHVLYDRGYSPVFLAKGSLFETPVVGWVLRHAKQVRVDRETDRAGEALTHAVSALEAGECVVVYPEGSLTRDPDLWPMRGKTGAARLALQSGAPVIPVAQWGPQDLLPRYAGRPRLSRHRTLMQIRFGAPVELGDLTGTEAPETPAAVATATDRIMAAITHELEGLRGQRAPTTRFDPAAHGLRVTGNYRSGDDT